MESLLHSLMAVTCAIVLLVSLPQFKKTWDKRDPQDRSFARLVIWVILFCLNDGIWAVIAANHPHHETLLFASTTIFFAAAAITAYLWLDYTLCYLGKRIHHPKAYRIPALLLVVAQFALLLINIKYQFLFSVNESGYYRKTITAQYLFYMQYATYIFIGIVCLIKMKTGIKKKDRRKFTAVFLCVLAPIICGILQLFFPFAPFFSIGYMLGCCVIFTHVVIHMTRQTIYRQDSAIMAALSADFDLICYIDTQRKDVRFQTMNPRFKQIFDEDINSGLPSTQKLDKFLRTVIVPEDLPEFLKHGSCENSISELAKEPTFVTRVRVKIDNVTEFYELKIVHDSESNLTGCVIGMHNISHEERIKEETEKLKHDLMRTTLIASRDPLTGVNNRAAFNQKSDELLRDIEQGKSVEFAIIECDLNNLKIVNDQLGHEAGDLFIKTNCRAFCETFKHSPVYRIGGDEFVIVVQGSDYEERDALLDKLRSLREPNEPLRADRISFAAGIAEFDPQVDKTPADVLKRADAFMYIHKRHIKKREHAQESWE